VTWGSSTLSGVAVREAAHARTRRIQAQRGSSRPVRTHGVRWTRVTSGRTALDGTAGEASAVRGAMDTCGPAERHTAGTPSAASSGNVSHAGGLRSIATPQLRPKAVAHRRL